MKDSQTKSIAPRVNDCDRVLRLLDELVDLEEADSISLLARTLFTKPAWFFGRWYVNG